MTKLADTIEREVWTTPAEFRHGLALAFPDSVTETSETLRVAAPQASMEIALEVMAPRRIALLVMPRLKVSIRLTGTSEQRRALLARMDLAMQRGGG
jgi:hypothetical protein